MICCCLRFNRLNIIFYGSKKINTYNFIKQIYKYIINNIYKKKDLLATSYLYKAVK